MIKRFSPPRRLLLLFGGALLAGLIWWRSQATLAGIWIGRTPPALCYDVKKALRLTRANTWEAQSYDFGCRGSYSVQGGTPPMIVFNPTSSNPPTFAYTVTDDLLVLQDSTGTYTLSTCLKSMVACAGGE
jgi:hypothetical protein